jgi:ActR/RegA family two-component response regulator
MKIVMLTTSAEHEDLFEAIKSGACGYLLKVTAAPAFIEAHGLEQGIPPFSLDWQSCCCGVRPAF